MDITPYLKLLRDKKQRDLREVIRKRQDDRVQRLQAFAQQLAVFRQQNPLAQWFQNQIERYQKRIDKVSVLKITTPPA